MSYIYKSILYLNKFVLPLAKFRKSSYLCKRFIKNYKRREITAMRNRIKQLQEHYRMNQLAFANATGIGNATLSNIYNGKTNPTLKHVELILANFPNVNLMWLVQGVGQMFVNQTAAGGESGSNNPTGFSATTSDGSANPLTGDAPNAPTDGDMSGEVYGEDDMDGTGEALGQMMVSPTLPGNISSNPSPTQGIVANNQYASSTAGGGVYQPSSQHDRMADTSTRRTLGRNASNSAPRMEMVQALPQQRKITEIRIFYDDQTWETFIPKNK